MKAAVDIYRYGSKRGPQEGLRIGVARYAPRAVSRADWRRRGYFDFWVPLLAPSRELLKKFQRHEIDFDKFAATYRREMKGAESSQIIHLLAGISLYIPLSFGCFCEDETACHRSVLRKLIADASSERRAGSLRLGKVLAESGLERFCSPVCLANWEEET